MNRVALLCGVLAIAAGSTYAPPARAAETIRCESVNGRYQSCGVDTRGGVHLSRQLSSQGCWQNDSWGYDRNRIWVTNGCRAEFQVGDYQSDGSNNSGAIAGVAVAALIGAAILANKNKHGSDRDDYYDHPGYGGGYDPRATVRCEATGGRQVYCRLPFKGHLEVSRQLSKAKCQYGVTWGVDGNNVWVNNGCRADFAVY
jgi:hypothetical protein